MKSSPINSLEVETCIPPLSLRRLQLAQRFALKVLSSCLTVKFSRIVNVLNVKFSRISAVYQSISANEITVQSLASLPEIV
jgi:hypothetical protein